MKNKFAKAALTRAEFSAAFSAGAETTFKNPYKLLMQEGVPDANAARAAFVKSVEGVFGGEKKLTVQELHGRLMATCANTVDNADFTRMNQIFAVERTIPKIMKYLSSGRPTL